MYDALEKALRDGDINYVSGVFVGPVSSKISKEIKALGGKMIGGYWTLSEYLVPPDLNILIKKKLIDANSLDARLSKKLDNIAEDIDKFVQTMEIKTIIDNSINVVKKQFKKTVRSVLAVHPELDVLGMEKIQRDYLTTTDLPIREKLRHEFKDRSKVILKNFSQETIEKLRKDLHSMILSGEPRKSVEKFIESRLKISKQRCRFIARQETALLTSKFKQSQYEQWGLKKYRWKSLGDHKVRLRHMELNGQDIYWNNPPIVDKHDNRTAHAGEDYNCRCIASPIVEW